jgi:HD-like signal output (HDOD) protein
MFLRFFGRRLAAPAPPSPAPVAALGGAACATPAPTASPRAGDGAAATLRALAEEARDVEQDARAALARRSERLLAQLHDHEGAADGVHLVETLLTAPADVIRQPPTAAQEALTAASDPQFAPARLVRLAEASPAIAQALLRSANSAQHAAAGAACVSLADAVRRLGAQGVADAVLCTMVDGLLCRPGVEYERLVEQVWSHMVRTAPLARALALAFAVAPGEAFALGLLHDVGKLVVFDRISALRRELRRPVTIPYPALAAILGELHEPLGALAVHRWGLGPNVAQAVGAHHATTPLACAAADNLRQIVFVAERAELARLRAEPMPLADWWDEGAVTASLDRAAPLLERELAAEAVLAG